MFYDELKKIKIKQLNVPIDDAVFDAVMNKSFLTMDDLPCLLGDLSDAKLEKMAVRANEESQRHFGKTIQLFTPLYLGNFCENQCIYCAFNHSFKVKRKKLSYEEVEEECRFTAKTELDELLLLTGESRKHTDVSYIADCAKIASKYFNSVAVEVYPLEVEEYERLIQSGVSGLTVYQETYDEGRYDVLHLSGPKKDFTYRLGTPERGAMAGMNRIQIGPLLGLADPLEDAYKVAAHMTYLLKKYPEVEWSMSLPRLKDIENGSFIGTNVDDRLFVKALLAMRLMFPKINISISTRESKAFREHLIPLGINKLSAGVSTAVGRIHDEDEDTSQFEISDSSSVEDIKKMVANIGYQVVFRNWVKLP